jgi:hypothetical protein
MIWYAAKVALARNATMFLAAAKNAICARFVMIKPRRQFIASILAASVNKRGNAMRFAILAA